jgi:hypothetical protein
MGRRKNGTGGVSLRKDGRWEGRVVCQEQHGKHLRKNMVYNYNFAINREISLPEEASNSAIRKLR